VGQDYVTGFIKYSTEALLPEAFLSFMRITASPSAAPLRHRKKWTEYLLDFGLI